MKESFLSLLIAIACGGSSVAFADECSSGYYCSTILACYGSDPYGKFEIHAGWKSPQQLYRPTVVARMKYDNPRWQSGDWGNTRVSYGDPFSGADISRQGLNVFIVSGSLGAGSHDELWIPAGVNLSGFKARFMQYDGTPNRHVLMRDVFLDCGLRSPR